MWLPKEERRLLQGYYINIGQFDSEKCFHSSSWGVVVNSKFVKRKSRQVKAYGEGAQTNNSNDNTLNKKIVRAAKDAKIVEVTNKFLEARKLITLRQNQNGTSVVGITLTLVGYDLGRKYNDWKTRTGLWFAEYKDHWFWLILSFLGGVLGALLVNWLSSLFTKNSGC